MQTQELETIQQYYGHLCETQGEEFARLAQLCAAGIGVLQMTAAAFSVDDPKEKAPDLEKALVRFLGMTMTTACALSDMMGREKQIQAASVVLFNLAHSEAVEERLDKMFGTQPGSSW